MADYNPNSNWTSKKRESVPVPAPKAVPAPSMNPLPAVKKENVETPPRTSGKGGGHGLVWFFVACAAFVAGAVFFFFFLRPAPGPDVSISFVKPDQVFIGDQFVFSVSLTNNSQIALKNASLEVILPDGFSFVGQSLDQRMMQQSIGDLALGSVTKQDFNLIATGNQNSVGHVTVKLVYGAGTVSANQFESDSTADIITGQSAVGLNFTIPQNVFAGQSFAITVDYNNNTSHAISNVVLNMQYPPAFVVSTSSVAPANGGSWNLGTIAGNAGGSITIAGTVSGQAGVAYPFTGTLTSNLSGINYSLNTATANAVLAASPLSLSIALNNTSTYIANAGDQLNYVLSYQNNSNVAFQNIVIQAFLAGDMYDFSSLKSDGSFNSIADAVTWSPATNQELTSLAPGQSGSVKIALVAKKSFPIKSASDKNYVLKMHAQIQSPTVPPNTSASSTIGMSDFTSNIRGEIVVAATGYRDDPSSGIVNTGPYPPVVNQPSQYTIHWDVTNYSTDVQNVTVSAYLQSGSTFTGQVKSSISSQPVYDAATGLVTWNIGNLSAGTGVLGDPAEAVFQITNTPAVNQVGQVVPFMTQTNLSANDPFTNSMLQASAASITTYLSTGNSGQVVQ